MLNKSEINRRYYLKKKFKNKILEPLLDINIVLKFCIKCKKEKILKEFHKDPIKLYGRCDSCITCRKEKGTLYWKNNRERCRLKLIEKKYNITVSQYKLLIEKQSNKCCICGIDGSQSLKGKLYVDHCHETKKVRGLLCNNCNVGIGNLQDSKQLLYNAIKYLENAN